MTTPGEAERLTAEVTLAECPPGPFLFQGRLGFKTEYHAIETKDAGGGKVSYTMTNRPEVYVMASGEAFWGGAKTKDARDALMVQPCEVQARASLRPLPGGDREADIAWLEEIKSNFLTMPDVAKIVGEPYVSRIDRIIAALQKGEEGFSPSQDQSDRPSQDGAQIAWRPAFHDVPEAGRRIVAVYDDGSGAVLLWRHHDGYIDADGQDRDDLDSFSVWAYLPASLKFWCEECEEPMTLKLPPSSPDETESEGSQADPKLKITEIYEQDQVLPIHGKAGET